MTVLNTKGDRNRGISIRDAVAILDARSESGGDRELNLSRTTTDSEGKAISQEQKNMGQTIDLFAWTKMGREQCLCPEPSDDNFDIDKVDPSLKSQRLKDAEKGKKKMDENRKQRVVEMRTVLQKLSIQELINAVFEAQRERTTTYKDFDKGLEQVIKTGNITNYPAVCARVTASFSVLSDTINTIGQILNEKHKRKDIEKLIRDLQTHEKEKLNTTAALHLEQIREKNESVGGDDAISDLLCKGIVSLRSKLGNIIPKINDILEELRYELDED